MKKFLALILGTLMLAACQPKSNETEEPTNENSAMEEGTNDDGGAMVEGEVQVEAQ